MAEKRYNLSEKDRDLLNRALSKVAHTRLTASGRPRDDAQIDLAQELLIAKAPDGGVPALVSSGSGSGTGSTTDEPGVANCQLYQVVVTDIFGADTAYPGTQISSEIREVLMAPVTVFNWTSAAIAAGTYFVVARDRFGTWLVIGAGATVSVIRLTSGTPTGGKYPAVLRSRVAGVWTSWAAIEAVDLAGAAALPVDSEWLAVYEEIETGEQVWAFKSVPHETGILSLNSPTPYGDGSYDCSVLPAYESASVDAWGFNLAGALPLAAVGDFLCHYQGMGKGGPTYVATGSNTGSEPPSTDWIVYLGYSAYDNAVTYSKGMVAIRSGNAYLYTNATPSSGHTPPNATYWLLLPGSFPLAASPWSATTGYVLGSLVQKVRRLYDFESAIRTVNGLAGTHLTLASADETVAISPPEDNNPDGPIDFSVAETLLPYLLTIVVQGEGDTVGELTLTPTNNLLNLDTLFGSPGGGVVGPQFGGDGVHTLALTFYDAGPLVGHGLINTGSQNLVGNKTFDNIVTISGAGIGAHAGPPNDDSALLVNNNAQVTGTLWVPRVASPGPGGSPTTQAEVVLGADQITVAAWNANQLIRGYFKVLGDPPSYYFGADYPGGGDPDPAAYPPPLFVEREPGTFRLGHTTPITPVTIPPTPPVLVFGVLEFTDGWLTGVDGGDTAAVGLGFGGTGTDLTGTGPGIVVQGTGGGPVGGAITVITVLTVSMGGTGADLSGTSGAGVIIQSAAGGALSQVAQLPPVLGGLGADNSGASVGDVPTWNGTAYVPGAGSSGGADEGSISSAFGGF